MTASPAAGPLTLTCDPDSAPISMPPAIPEMIPAKSGAPDAKAIPRHKGSATRNTTAPAGPSCLRELNSWLLGRSIDMELLLWGDLRNTCKRRGRVPAERHTYPASHH